MHKELNDNQSINQSDIVNCYKWNCSGFCSLENDYYIIIAFRKFAEENLTEEELNHVEPWTGRMWRSESVWATSDGDYRV